MISEHLIIGLLLRLIFTVYGEWHDKHSVVKYTDVDYLVFNDAAHHVAKGESPLERHTYRYTPLLAYLLLPNVYVHFCFGKLLFVFADMLTAYLIYVILMQFKLNKNVCEVCTYLWIYNPVPIAVSTRGNAEAIICTLVLMMFSQFCKQKFALAGVLLGFSVHFKLYPVIYSPALYIGTENLTTLRKLKGDVWSLFHPTKQRITFMICTLLGFAIPTFLSYVLCGQCYIDEAFLYHITRKDTRHNFSPYFYMLYLTELWDTKWISIITFVPQFLVLLQISFKFSTVRYLPLCLFAETFVFVMLNKVCTSQYFLWYLCLLPLIVPHVHMSYKDALKCSTLWLGGQGLWLLPAYFTEFQGLNCFTYIWLAGLIFYLINVYILCKLIKSYKKNLG